MACKYGLYKVVKMLYNLDGKINIRMNNDEVFNYSVENKDDKLARFLIKKLIF